MKDFKTTECNKLFNVWISNFPESSHPLDIERFVKLVISILDNDESLEYDQIQQSSKKIEEWQIERYMEKYNTMRDMYNVLKNEGRIK